MSKYRQTHLEVKRHLGEPARMTAICGFDYTWEKNFTQDEAKVTCPTCLGHIHRRLLAERPADAPKLALDIDRDQFNGAYRYVYRALLGGEHVAWVVYDGAYGKARWRLCVINRPNDKDKRTIGYQLARDEDEVGAYSRISLGFPTKEAALMAVPELRAGGRLRTLPELNELHADSQRRQARWKIERAAEAKQEAEDREIMLAGIESLLARGDLTNIERAAVTLMQRRIPQAKEAA
jgi:hypothetical protein